MNRNLLTLTLFFILFATTAPVSGQDMQTLIGGETTHGGFGGPVVKFSDVQGELGVWAGGRGGWIINFDRSHAISIGGAGYGLVTEHRISDLHITDPDKDLYIMNGYGGFEMEYINQSYRVAHFTLSVLVGGGGVTVRERDFSEVDHNHNRYFVFEPGANIELNVTHFFRFLIGASYRLTSGIDMVGYRDSDFSGVNGNLTLKFGSF